MLFATIFLLCFVLLGGLVMYLSQTIEHGEARFDADGKVMREDDPNQPTDAQPARRLEDNETKANDDE